MTRFIAAALMLTAASLPQAQAQIADSATAVRPILVGSAAPAVNLTTLDGKTTTLSALLAGKPTVLVFYRGGWCPFCNLQLSELRKLNPDLKAQGFQLLAISPDRAEELARTVEKDELDYTLASDAKAQLFLRIRNTSVHRFEFLGDSVFLTQFGATPHLDRADRHQSRTYF